jgi:cysteine-rich repeat protein
MCGDGILDPGEECDDHDQQGNDGCSATCAIEAGYRCKNAVNVNTGSDNAGGRAAVGTNDLVWSWSEGFATTRFPARVAGNCPNDPNLWVFAGPYAEWVNRYGCSVNSPFDNTTYYHATFNILTAEAASVTAVSGRVWADNKINDVIVNGVSTGLSSSGEIGYNGPGIYFGAWPSSLYVKGINTITVAVYNAGSSPNPDGLLVQAPNAFGVGSICDSVNLSIAAAGSTAQRGNTAGGTPYADACPTGQVMVGIDGTAGAWFTQIQAVCGALSISASLEVTVGAGATLPLRGNIVGSPLTSRCPANQMVVGFAGRAGGLMDQIALRCAPLLVTETESGYSVTRGVVTALTPAGGTGGAAFPDTDCGTGQIASGANIRAGDSVDAFGLLCGQPSVD